MSVWLIWFGFCFLAFLAVEVWVLSTGRPTLSQTVWDLGREYPIFAAMVGAAFGGLFVHFFDWR